MTASLMIRRSAAALLAVALGLATLPGCGGSSPEKKDEKKDDKKTDPNATNPNTTPNSTPSNPNIQPSPGSVQPKLGPIDPGAEQAADAFLREVKQGMARADMLSSAFVRSIGKPLLLPSDKTKGYSEDAATSWLRKVGDGVNFFPSLERNQVGDVAYIRGSITGERLGKEPNKSGNYYLRMLKEGGNWKVDWFSLSSVDSVPVAPTSAPTPEGVAQRFAATAFIESVADLNGMPRDERMIILAAAMTPALRQAWAPPFDQDKAAGYDFNPGKLGTEAVKVAGGTSTYTATRVGDQPEFKVELTKPTGKKTYVVKLVKGAAPHEWLVSEVTEAKG
jgi:hypothetical protein